MTEGSHVEAAKEVARTVYGPAIVETLAAAIAYTDTLAGLAVEARDLAERLTDLTERALQARKNLRDTLINIA